MHNRWEVFRGDSTNASDLLFTVKRSTLMQLRTELDVFLAGNTAQQACDFRMKGSYFDRNCVFYLGNSDVMIAQVSTKLIWFLTVVCNHACMFNLVHVCKYLAVNLHSCCR